MHMAQPVPEQPQLLKAFCVLEGWFAGPAPGSTCPEAGDICISDRRSEDTKTPCVTHLPSLKVIEKELNHRHAGRTFNTRSLQRLMERLAKELLAVLYREGPSTEGIFRRAASGTALRELREALDRGLDIDMGSQPADLLAVVLKVSASDLQMQELLPGLASSRTYLELLSLQDFLRNIPSKLLVEDLYEEWMAAIQKTSTEEKIAELKVWSFGRAKWPRRQRRREPSGKNLSGCPPSLLEHLEESGGDTMVEGETAEVPPSSTAMTSNSATEPLEKLEEPRSPSEERRVMPRKGLCQPHLEMEEDLFTQQELLAVLHQEGPSTEGIFRRAASGTALRELREALDRGLDIDMGSQPADLLAVALKVSASDLQMEELLAGLAFLRVHLEPLSLQDFLRNIPSKLLVEDLYEEWMAAIEKTSTVEKIEALKVELLYVLLHSNKSFVCTCFCFLDGHVEEPRGPGGRADKDHQVKAFLDAPSSLLDNLKESGGDTVVEGETAEHCGIERFAGSLQEKEKGRNQKRRQTHGDDSDNVVEKKRRKRNNISGGGTRKRYRNIQRVRKPRVMPRKGLCQPHLEMEEDSVTEQELLAVLRQKGPSTEGIFRRAATGTALRELREALDRGLDVDMGSQPADLLAVILKDFLRNIPSKLLVEDLYEEWMAAMERCSMEEKMEEMKVPAFGRAKWPHRRNRREPSGTSIFNCNDLPEFDRVSREDGKAEEPFRGKKDKEKERKRKRIEVWAEEDDSQMEKKRKKRGNVSGDGAKKRHRKVQRFRKPRVMPRKGLCQPHLEMEEDSVTEQELLAVLRQEGPSTEGIFRRAATGTALRELREALDRGLDVDIGSQPADLLAVILKDFLRNIPSKLLVEDLYEEWMAALERCSMEEKMEEMKVPAFGRAKWPRRQSRREQSGKNLSGCPPILPENLKGAGGDTVVESKMAEHCEMERFAGSPKDKEKERKRKRIEVWGEEDDSQMEKKRKKRGNVSGDGAKKRHRKVQRFRKPRVMPRKGLCQPHLEMEVDSVTEQELLAVLRQEGPSTEGIFCRATSGTALRELREALDRGLDVDMGSQPADLLAVILKDFLRNIPSKLLVEDLYEEWMAAMERCSMEEKMEEMKVPAFGRAKWPRRQSRREPSGTSIFNCNDLPEFDRVSREAGKAEEPFRGKKDKEKERKRKRIEVWGEEDDSQMEKKRKKRGNVSGDGARKRHRKVQRFRKPRSRFPVSS
ncbi:hypothetical protein Q9966_012249 [Columba livia]|nr:hypothetical protein Q9966_012249 [Columba livia]